MTVAIHPGIANLEPGSLTSNIYLHLYHNFFNAQDKKDEEHPYGIVEGDDTSIRLHNMAFNFAEAIAGGITGEGSGSNGGVLLEYLKKTGGDMSGRLTANTGFEAGYGNNKSLETTERGVKITGDLEIGASDLWIGGKQLISYNNITGTALLSSPIIDFSNSTVLSKGAFIIGATKETGVYISSETLLIKNKKVYHGGNANKENIDWTMLHADVKGSLSVKGCTVLSDLLTAIYGAELGFNGKVYLDTSDKKVNLYGYLSILPEYGIIVNDYHILKVVNDNDIQVGSANGNLILGSDDTNKIVLNAGITDMNEQYILISKYGAAYFPDSLTVRHNFGDVILSTYRKDSDDEGIIINKRLRFGSNNGAYLHGKNNGLGFVSSFVRISESVRYEFTHETHIKYDASDSRYKPLDRLSNSAYLNTDADFFVFNKPVEARGHISIDNSFTRLADGALFFSYDSYLLSVADGIKHFGNAYIKSNISSEFFSSGFAGSGWAIIHNKTTGNIAATFDELTIRKKMRIYELEVQKISATNGSLWVSDNCSGDTVQKL